MEAVPPEAIYIRNGDTLEEGDDQERNVPGEVVEENEHVVPCAVSEDHADHAADAAADA